VDAAKTETLHLRQPMSYLDNPPRPIVNERVDYEPTGPREKFIVPLLRFHIERALRDFAAPAPPSARALDVGCGRQPFRKTLESLGYSFTGIDVQQNPENTVDFIGAIDEALPKGLVSRGPFHFILCTEVMEHVADWDQAFKNLAALLEQGGRLLITCPQFYRLHEEPYDFWRPTLHALRYFGGRAGLRTLHDVAAGGAWDVLGTLLADCLPHASTNRIAARGLAKLVSLSMRVLLKLLYHGGLQRTVRLRSAHYLSNIIVFEL
jgi:SAM-dependent methyltransferase